MRQGAGPNGIHQLVCLHRTLRSSLPAKRRGWPFCLSPDAFPYRYKERLCPGCGLHKIFVPCSEDHCQPAGERTSQQMRCGLLCRLTGISHVHHVLQCAASAATPISEPSLSSVATATTYSDGQQACCTVLYAQRTACCVLYMPMLDAAPECGWHGIPWPSIDPIPSIPSMLPSLA